MPTKEQIIDNIRNEKYFTEDLYTTHIKYEIEKLQVKAVMINHKHVKRIIEVVNLYDTESQMSPIVVIYRGTIPIRLIDGNHTLEARLHMGLSKTRVIKIPEEEFGGDEELIMRVAAGLNNPEWVKEVMSDADIKRMIAADMKRMGEDYIQTLEYRDKMSHDMGRARNGVTTMVRTVLKEGTPRPPIPVPTTTQLNNFGAEFGLYKVTNSERVHNTGIGAALQLSDENGGEQVHLIVYHRNAVTAHPENAQLAEEIIERFDLPITVIWWVDHEPER